MLSRAHFYHDVKAGLAIEVLNMGMKMHLICNFDTIDWLQAVSRRRIRTVPSPPKTIYLSNLRQLSCTCDSV